MMERNRSPMIDGDYLAHYGRLGMKWGQNIFTRGKSSKKTSSKKTSSKAKKRSVKKKKIKDMTDAELIKKRDRLRLEKEVRILDEETGPASKRIARKAISNASQKVLEEVFHDVVKYSVASFVNKHAGAKVINIKTGDDEKKQKKAA